ncbi:MAG TPA: ATP-binding protein [Mycobacteriales bacterium]|jgi:anti-sigma regulatory factor (Ser/Thr protein kinase)
MATVELRFTALPAHVRTARLLAAVLARRAGVDETYLDEVKLAVGEACARAVGIHQATAGGEDVTVELSDDEGRFVVAVRDCGPPEADTALEATGSAVAGLPDLMDPDELTSADSDPAPLPSGFGLAVIAGLVDDLDVSAHDGGTVVRMTWTAEGDPLA